ncbi:hypothetical protein CRUP_023971, partial [Coryphaenoides rupestris]
MGIKLVFVMEGEAPKLKAETMSKRTESRFGCAEMLDCLGVPWVTAAGEAEAMCAYLDSQGLVDGCITNDGDAFLYGAKTDPLVDRYRTSRVQSELHLSRENLVGLAILLGCDYIPKGIPGVGSAKAHERGGCLLCHSQRFCQPQDFDYQCPCDWHATQQIRQASSFEAGIRKQNFAYQKMEWPKHYTSEKVLVLMTYTELMNRICRKEASSQIKPLRSAPPHLVSLENRAFSSTVLTSPSPSAAAIVLRKH